MMTATEYENTHGLVAPDIYEPLHEKTSLRGLRPGKTQTGLRSQRSYVEA